MSSLKQAFRFLTVIRIPSRQTADSGLAGAVAWFPLVGAAMGGVFVGIDRLAFAAFPTATAAFVAAALVLTSYALLTGGLHHDGLADSADALWGLRAGGRQRRLEVMKDSNTGALGVTALVLLLLTELAALTALGSQATAGLRRASLVAVPVLGRWCMSYLCVRFRYARDEGTGRLMAGGARPVHLAVAGGVAAAALAGCFAGIVRLPWMMPILAAVTLAWSELWGRACSRALGGVTGDVIGAGGMLLEAFLLLLLASSLPQLVGG